MMMFLKLMMLMVMLAMMIIMIMLMIAMMMIMKPMINIRVRVACENNIVAKIIRSRKSQLDPS